MLNSPRYLQNKTFEGFICEKSNRQARDLVHDSYSTKHSGEATFLYACQGNGSTHLVMAAINRLQNRDRVSYFCAQELYSSFKECSLQHNKIFSTISRNTDYLFIDDCSYFLGPNALPKEVKKFIDELKYFLASKCWQHVMLIYPALEGLNSGFTDPLAEFKPCFPKARVAYINAPEYPLMRKFALRSLSAFNLDIDNETIDTIVRQSMSIREVEGRIIKLNAEKQLSNWDKYHP